MKFWLLLTIWKIKQAFMMSRFLWAVCRVKFRVLCLLGRQYKHRVYVGTHEANLLLQGRLYEMHTHETKLMKSIHCVKASPLDWRVYVLTDYPKEMKNVPAPASKSNHTLGSSA